MRPLTIADWKSWIRKWERHIKRRHEKHDRVDELLPLYRAVAQGKRRIRILKVKS